MLSGTSNLFQSSVRLADLFKQETKNELKEIAHRLYTSIPSKLRKDAYAETLADWVLNNPKEWLPMLTHYDLTLLQKLVAAGANTYIEEPCALLATPLSFLDLIVLDDVTEQEGTMRYMMCDELREVVSRHLLCYLNNKELDMHFLIDRYALGLVNLYGLLPYVYFLPMLLDCMPESVSEADVTERLMMSCLLRDLTVDMAELPLPLLIHSPYVRQIDSLLDSLLKRADMEQFKTFTNEEIFQAGAMPLIHIPNPYTDELKSFMMNRLHYTAAKVELEIHCLWQSAQIETDSVMSFINPLINGKLSSMRELQEAIELITAYINYVPRWFLKGYTSTETALLYEKDAMRKRPSTPGMQSAADDLFYETIVGQPKVGRNDLCPCGSGKKYKKCCGNN